VQLAGEPPSLELLPLEHPAERVPCDSLREVDRERRARREDLRETDVGVGEAGLRAELVVDGDDPDRPAADEQRHVEPGADAHPARLVLVDLRVVEDRVDAGALTTLEDAPALRAGAIEALLEQSAGGSVGGVGGRDSQIAVGLGERDQHEAGADQLAQAAADDLQQLLEVRLRDERPDDLVQ
jgi:hypothetical protein